MDDAVGGNDAVALGEILGAGIVGDCAAGFLYDQTACHEVPLADVCFGIAIETACCDVAEGHGGGTTHADAAHMAIEGVDEVTDDGLVGIAVVGQLQTEQGILYLLRTDVKRLTVEESSPTLRRIETLVGTDLIDYTKEYVATLQEGDAHGIRGILVDEVRGAVEGVDHPEQPFGIVAGKSLLGDETCLGQKFAQGTDDELLGAFVDIRHVVVGMFALHPFEGELTALVTDIGSCPTGNLTDGLYKIGILFVHRRFAI